MGGTAVKGLRCVVALCTLGWVLAFALPGGAATSGNDSCGYASSSFTESTVMRWAQLNGTGLSSQIVAYGNDEKGLLLGVNGATPMSAATQNGSNGQTGGASYHAAGASGGSATATDPSGRPYFPALYITNVTANPSNPTAGDLQKGGTPRNVSGGKPFVDDVFGTWATATVGSGGSNYKVTAPLDKNNWNLGTGSDAPVGTTFSAMGNEGYGAEVRWNVSDLTDSQGQPLQPGNTYRIQIIEHDGDQNKSGGDAGEFCVNLTIPKGSATLTTTASNGKTGGTIQDSATLSGGANPTGTITWNVYASSDSSCSSPLNSQPSTLTTSVHGNGTYSSPAYSPPGAGSYKWVATYSGDSANASISTACNDPNEVSQVTQASSPGIRVVKLEKVAGSGGGFTRGPVTVTEQSGNYVVHTIEYEIQVTNTGNVPLTLSLSDPQCDAGTVQGPAVISGTLNGKTLSPGGVAQYTCSHRYVQGDPTPFANVATVTGTPPSGPPVSGTSKVTVTRSTVSPKHVCRSLRTGRIIRYKGHRKPRACLPKKPHRHRGFTG